MILVGFLVLILAITTMIRISIFDYFQGISILFHNFCLVRLNFDFLSQAELQALVCGKNFSNFETANLYMASGLIHLFVVSGAHLLIIENFIVKFFSRNHITTAYFIIIILSIYALACKLNPPITRSLISVMVSMTIIRNHLRWPENFKIFVCGLLALLFNPSWIASVSLQLSWLAAMVVSINSLYLSKEKIFLKQSFFFLALFPLLIFFQVPNPITILSNLIFAPILEFVLFPLGLLVWLIPPAYPLFDFLIKLLRVILKNFEFNTSPQGPLDMNLQVLVGWTVILLLHFYLHFKEMSLRRQFYV